MMTNSPTLAEMQVAKRDIELTMENALSDFVRTYGVYINRIEIQEIPHFSTKGIEPYYDVKIKLDL